MKKYLIFFLFAYCSKLCSGQIVYTRTAFIGFYSSTPLEDIRGENNQAFAVIDIGKKELAFTALVKGFIFPKELMQEHFNENYVESDKYPKTSFTGSFSGEVPWGKDGRYPVVVKGQLTLHNVVKAIEIPAVLEIKGGTVFAIAEFKVMPDDFHISIPSLVRDKIAREIKVNVKANCNPK